MEIANNLDYFLPGIKPLYLVLVYHEIRVIVVMKTHRDKSQKDRSISSKIFVVTVMSSHEEHPKKRLHILRTSWYSYRMIENNFKK